LHYLVYILFCTAPLSYGWGGALANPDDMMMIWWYAERCTSYSKSVRPSVCHSL